MSLSSTDGQVPVLSVEQVNVRFGGVQAVQDVSLQAFRGQVTDWERACFVSGAFIGAVVGSITAVFGAGVLVAAYYFIEAAR